MQAMISDHDAEERRQAGWAIGRIVGGTLLAFVSLFIVAALVHPALMGTMMAMAAGMMK